MREGNIAKNFSEIFFKCSLDVSEEYTHSYTGRRNSNRDSM